MSFRCLVSNIEIPNNVGSEKTCVYRIKNQEPQHQKGIQRGRCGMGLVEKGVLAEATHCIRCNAVDGSV